MNGWFTHPCAGIANKGGSDMWSVEPVKFCRDCGEILVGEQEIKDGQCWECWVADDVDDEDCDDDD